ncbi:hypothetical protein BSG1_07304 [Bacillus sp. SG-1]|nr:hypothetical protein BSG1_07304 [Bacillus sp. SG-1]
MWINPLGKEIKDPLLQMKRAESLFRQQAQKLGFNPLVESYLIFVNPEFYLYNPPDNPSIIYPAQLNRFMKKLQNRSLKVSKLDIKLAEKLLALHINESPYSRLPEYKFEDLRKGILCFNCRRLYHNVEGRSLVCDYCGGKENNQIAILRTVREFQLLFPHEKLTTNKILTMCGGIYENRTVRKVLLDNFEKIRSRNHAFYVDKS